MNTVYVVICRDTRSEFTSIEAICATPEGAEVVRKDRQMIWGEGNVINPARYRVNVREMVLNP